MKTRLISALIAMLIFIPILFIGGTLFNVAVYIISKKKKKNYQVL